MDGSTILVPKTETENSDIPSAVADSATMAVAPDVPETRRIHVKVGKRDTLASIAARYSVTVVPGVSSLTACAAAASVPLVQRDETLAVIPATLAEDALACLAGFAVLGRWLGLRA